VKKVRLKKKDWQLISKALIWFALLAVVLAGWGFVVADFWLASTQWLLVAAVLAVFGLYTKTEK